MTLRPCLTCGEPGTGPRCAEHRPRDTRRNRGRGHANDDPRWRKLSTKLRKLSPFCEMCGARDDLTVDHIIPTTEDPKLAHEPLNCRVLCRSCNAKRGNTCTDTERDAVHAAIAARKARAARFYATQTRGETPLTSTDTPGGRHEADLIPAPRGAGRG